MTVHVEVVTPCEHDQWNPHRSGDGEIVASSDGAEIMAVICRGASRKAFTEWPPEAIEAAAKVLRVEEERYRKGWNPLSYDDAARSVLAAALGHITGDK